MCSNDTANFLQRPRSYIKTDAIGNQGTAELFYASGYRKGCLSDTDKINTFKLTKVDNMRSCAHDLV
jgi:hypothetical protein